MATSFPTSVQALTNVTDNVDYPTAATVNYLNDTVEALEAKVGADSSAVSTSIDYILNNKIWPIGSVFLSVVATNPNTLLGFGTWSQIGGGKVLVGQTDGDADFNVAEETGGDKTKTIAKANLPDISTGAGTAHTHIQNQHRHTYIVADDTVGAGYPGAGDSQNINSYNSGYATPTNQTESAHTHSLGGSGTALSVVQPYMVVYFWKRTA